MGGGRSNGGENKAAAAKNISVASRRKMSLA